jgi:ubiquinone/menaquinone biosynthesis C-methylase UbiE
MPTNPDSESANKQSHHDLVHEQFGLQAEGFARSQELHGEAVLKLLVDAADPKPSDELLDVACGPGTVVAAFAGLVRRAVGLDTTEAVIEQARSLAT